MANVDCYVKPEKPQALYGIRVTKYRYINWCDDFWYESVNFPVFNYTLEQAKELVPILCKHFKYNVVIVGTDGTEIKYSFGKEVTGEEADKVTEQVNNINEEDCDEDVDIALL